MATTFDRRPEANGALRVGLARGTADQTQEQAAQTAEVVGALAAQMVGAAQALEGLIDRSAQALAAAQAAQAAAQEAQAAADEALAAGGGGGGGDVGPPATAEDYAREIAQGSLAGPSFLLTEYPQVASSASVFVTLLDTELRATDIGDPPLTLPTKAAGVDQDFAGLAMVWTADEPAEDAAVSMSRRGATLRAAIYEEGSPPVVFEEIHHEDAQEMELALYPTPPGVFQTAELVFAPLNEWRVLAASEFSASAPPVVVKYPVTEEGTAARMSQFVVLNENSVLGGPALVASAWPADPASFGTLWAFDPIVAFDPASEENPLSRLGGAGTLEIFDDGPDRTTPVAIRTFSAEDAVFRLVDPAADAALADSHPSAVPRYLDPAQPYDQPFLAAATTGLPERPQILIAPAAEHHFYQLRYNPSLPASAETRLIVERRAIPAETLAQIGGQAFLDRPLKFAHVVFSPARQTYLCIPLGAGPILEVTGGFFGMNFCCTVFATAPGDGGFLTFAAHCSADSLFLFQRSGEATRTVVTPALYDEDAQCPY